MTTFAPSTPSSLRRRALCGGAVALGALALYLLAWPISIEPQAWTPPPAPGFEGDYHPEAVNALDYFTELALPGRGPEDVAIGPDGALYAGTREGTLWKRPHGPTGTWSAFVSTGGRPLGLAFAPNGDLLVADAVKGLLAVTPTGRVSVLSTEADGLPFGLCDDLAVTRRGVVYFTDATFKPTGADDTQAEVLEHGPNGRLLKYDPATRRTTVVAAGLHFANGVALSADESVLLVNELTRYRVLRFWLSGPKAGQQDVAVENLPGHPDGITADGHGGYWVALISPRVPILDRFLPHPFIRKIITRLPRFLVYYPKPFLGMVHLAADGHPDRTVVDPDGSYFSTVTNVLEHDDKLFMGSLTEPAIGVVRLKPKPDSF